MLTLTDIFAGAGGSSTGAMNVPGVEVTLAANHWQLAVTSSAQKPKSDGLSRYNEDDPRGAGNTISGLTHSLDYGKEGLMPNPTRVCTIEGCENPHKGRGLCNKHLLRLRHTGTTERHLPTQEERFWAKVNKDAPNGCWEWTAALTSTGYGALHPSGRRSGPVVKAHRYSAELAGMDVEDKFILHSCDNPKCVNPAHLRPGTPADNVDDMMLRGRHVEVRKVPASEHANIRARAAAGELHRVIAADYGVSRPTVSRIVNGR